VHPYKTGPVTKQNTQKAFCSPAALYNQHRPNNFCPPPSSNEEKFLKKTDADHSINHKEALAETRYMLAPHGRRLSMSVFGGKADIICTGQNVR
jgi:hypothetical protein